MEFQVIYLMEMEQFLKFNLITKKQYLHTSTSEHLIIWKKKKLMVNIIFNLFLEFIYPSIGRTPSGGIFKRLKNLLKFKNNGNINLLSIDKGGLLALNEGGHPHLLNK